MTMRRSALLVGLTAVALTVSGCGGGGGSSTPRASMQEPDPTPAPAAPTPAPAAPTPAPAAPTPWAKAAGNTPNSVSGSVTQSSTGDGGVTTDSVSVEMERDAGRAFSYTFRQAGGWSTGDRAQLRTGVEDEGFKVFVKNGNSEGDTMTLLGATDIEAAAAGEGSAEPVQDADYLTIGVWSLHPPTDSSAASLEFGAVADGPDLFRQANLAGLTGTATYRARENGVVVTYSQRHAEDSVRGYFAGGDVTLTARFGDASSLGSIEGTVSNIVGDEGTTVPDWYDHEGTNIRLEAAPIGSADSGFFTGATSSSGTDSAFTGKWGGKFYGNGGAAGGHPGSVAGTFGAATADGGESFIGAFGAHR